MYLHTFSASILTACLALPAFAATSVQIPLTGLRIQNNLAQSASSTPATIDHAYGYRVTISDTTRVRGTSGLAALLFPTPVTLQQLATTFGTEYQSTFEVYNASGALPVTLGGQTLSGSTTTPFSISFSATLASSIDATGIASFNISQVVITPTTVGSFTFTQGFVEVRVVQCGDVDFNNDGVFPDFGDLQDFLNVLGGGDCPLCDPLDFNRDGVFPDDEDFAEFLRVLGGASCE